MKFVKLRTHAYVNGVLRSPAEGTLHLEDGEAQRLIDNEAAEDVTDGFDGDQHDAPVERVTTVANVDAGDSAPGQHQSEIAPAASDAPPSSTADTTAKTAAKKEA